MPSPRMANQQDADLHPNSNSPIFRIPKDVLWHIFTLNADTKTFRASMDPDKRSHPLNMTRFSSQVCHQWRELIIRSPAIWAGMIDLDMLTQTADELWMNEVLRRTDQALLSVFGGRGVRRHPGPRQFFISLLKDHWTRIRVFDVMVTDPDGFDAKLWNVFWETPSPNLEEFSLKSYGGIFTFASESRGHALFSDIAPSLRAFHCTQVGFNYRAGWVSQLRSLGLFRPITVWEALDVVSQIQNLETLVFQPAYNEVPLPFKRLHINLPRLRRIAITGAMKATLTFLEHITPAATCEFSFLALDQLRENVTELEADHTTMVAMIFRLVETYLKERDVRECTIEAGYYWFSFTAPGNGHKASHPTFSVSFKARFQINLGEIFPPRHLKTVTNFVFDYGGEDHNLDTFILSLTSLKTLQLSPDAIARIDKLSLENPLMFPSLSMVKLLYSTSEPFESTNHLALASFLSSRKQAGLPISVLDISRWPNRERWWEYLENVEGLKVVWEADDATKEYICGFGEPEKLRF